MQWTIHLKVSKYKLDRYSENMESLSIFSIGLDWCNLSFKRHIDKLKLTNAYVEQQSIFFRHARYSTPEEERFGWNLFQRPTNSTAPCGTCNVLYIISPMLELPSDEEEEETHELDLLKFQSCKGVKESDVSWICILYLIKT